MNEVLLRALADRPGWVAETLPTAVDGRAVVGNPVNGDVMYLGLRVDRETEQVTELLWRVEGSDIGIALASLIVRVLAGKMIAELQQLSCGDFWELIGMRENGWEHHGMLVHAALQKACNAYFAKTGQRERITKEERVVICACADISDFDIRQVYLRGNQRLEDIVAATGAGKECDMCAERLQVLHEELLREFPMNGNVHIRS